MKNPSLDLILPLTPALQVYVSQRRDYIGVQEKSVNYTADSLNDWGKNDSGLEICISLSLNFEAKSTCPV